MKTTQLKETFGRSPLHTKIMVIAGVLMTLSAFLPWYRDVDTYRTGDQFLGVTGPTAFIGVGVFLLSASSLLINGYRMMGRRFIKLPWRESSYHLFTGIQSLFLLLVANSIFFHPKFGINITLKESLFGMTIGLFATIAFCAGAYMMKREEMVSGEHNTVGHLDALINFDKKRDHAPVAQTTRPEEPTTHETRAFMFGDAPKPVTHDVDQNREQLL